MRQGIATILDVISVLAAMSGGVLILFSLLPPNSAVQTCALSAVGIGIAAVPYIIAGAFHRGAVRRLLDRRD
ncbi:hypothetical protein [Sphingomonas sp. HMP6]|uniref:hypothetical protein n=1 Tax=Sphingomonas sp. HMP6 TaxID=1517551 RepID=UPI0015967AE3|nr:hypothetical protein [Sphingomonas sp. HMP6]